MTNNSDGLTPTLRPQLGVGWNRALPAAFGFGNCWTPDGVNDYFTVPRLLTTSVPNEWSFEFWFKLNTITANQKGHINIVFVNGQYLRIHYEAMLNLYVSVGATAYLINTPMVTGSVGDRVFISVALKSGILNVYCNGLLKSSISMPTTLTSTISTFEIGRLFNGSPAFHSVDEFRYYHREVTFEDHFVSYNSGIGNNPARTEGLRCWLTFENFESLDFSQVQDGSDMGIGIMDVSGMSNHAKPFNMDTNPASPTYVLKPF
jgi:hypothetical protein